MKQEKDIRCGVCNRKLAQGQIISIQIKCPRCKSMNSLRDMSPLPVPLEGQEQKENHVQLSKGHHR